MRLKVLAPFKDKNDHETVYQSGDVLSTDEIGRVNDLVRRGLCEIVSVEKEEESDKPETVSFRQGEYALEAVKKALGSIGVKTGNAGVKSVSKKLDELTGEQADSLFDMLNKEV